MKELHLTEYSLTLTLWMDKPIILHHRLWTHDLQAWNRNLEQVQTRCRVSGQLLRLSLWKFLYRRKHFGSHEESGISFGELF